MIIEFCQIDKFWTQSWIADTVILLVRKHNNRHNLHVSRSIEFSTCIELKLLIIVHFFTQIQTRKHRFHKVITARRIIVTKRAIVVFVRYARQIRLFVTHASLVANTTPAPSIIDVRRIDKIIEHKIQTQRFIVDILLGFVVQIFD